MVEENIGTIKKGNDVLIIVLPGLEINDFWQLKEICNKLLKKANLNGAK